MWILEHTDVLILEYILEGDKIISWMPGSSSFRRLRTRFVNTKRAYFEVIINKLQLTLLENLYTFGDRTQIYLKAAITG